MAEATKFETVRVRRLEVVDDDDVVRVAAFCRPESDDAVFIELYTPKHNALLAFEARDGGVAVHAYSRGNPVLVLSVGDDGRWSVEDGRFRTLVEGVTE